MSSEEFSHYIQAIRRRIASLRETDREAWDEIDALLDEVYVTYEEMQTSLEAAEFLEQGLIQQNERITAGYHHYHDLFHTSPIACLVTDANGLILEGNEAIAHLLNLPQRYLPGKPLALYVAEGDRSTFRHRLSQLSRRSGIQIWPMNLCPSHGEPIAVECHVAIMSHTPGQIESLQIGVYEVRPPQEAVRIASSFTEAGPTESPLQDVAERVPVTALPQSLDGLRVLVVDDEADVRDFITVMLESYGIGVKAVASAAAALEELPRFHPNVLLSDIRMPDVDGYSLIRRIRSLEAGQGNHIPAAAITAYLEEDREKALHAGFEAHLHKLAPPSEWVELVAQLARQTLNEA